MRVLNDRFREETLPEFDLVGANQCPHFLGFYVRRFCHRLAAALHCKSPVRLITEPGFWFFFVPAFPGRMQRCSSVRLRLKLYFPFTAFPDQMRIVAVLTGEFRQRQIQRFLFQRIVILRQAFPGYSGQDLF